MHVLQTKRTVITLANQDVIEVEVSYNSVCITMQTDVAEEPHTVSINRDDLAKDAGYRNAIETLAHDLLALVAKAKPQSGSEYR